LQLYCELYRHRDQLVIIDDVDQLCTDRDSITLLKCVCQTVPVKRVRWLTAAPLLRREGIPYEFETRSKVAIIGNAWKKLNPNIEAVNDRGILVTFEPTAEEVHEWVRGWYVDRQISDEVFNFIGDHLDLIVTPSARHYVTAQQAMNASLTWQGALYKTWDLSDELIAAAGLVADEALTPKEREAEFQKATGKSRATYHRLVQQLRGGGRKR
jgi:hypothetical protein